MKLAQNLTQKRNRFLTIRVTNAQYEKLQKAASTRKITISELALERIFVAPKSDYQMSLATRTNAKLNALIRGLIEVHRVNSLGVGKLLLRVSDEEDAAILEYRTECVQTLLAILGDEGKTKL